MSKSGTEDVVRRRRRRMALIAGAVVLMLLVPLAWSALRDEEAPPEVFTDVVGLAAGFIGPPVAGVEHHFDVAAGPYPDVRVTSMRPVLGEGAVAATAVSVCRLPSGEPLGVGPGDLAASCTDVWPVDGMDLGPLGPQDLLVVTIVPLLGQRVIVTGLEVTYDDDGRERTEVVDGSLHVGGDDTSGNFGPGSDD